MRQRSSYPSRVQKRLQPRATASNVVISHGINANVIRKWLLLYRDQPPAAMPAFVLLRAPPADAESQHSGRAATAQLGICPQGVIPVRLQLGQLLAAYFSCGDL